jgi:hypothetical protein
MQAFVFKLTGPFHPWFQALDRILRGEATRPAALKRQTVDVPVAGLSLVLFALAVSYGVCMGVYSGFHPDGSSVKQWLACAVKVPALFFLTLCVTFPSLYVFNALVGSRLLARSVLQLLVSALAVNLAVLSSLGPIVAFFSFCTTSSPFMTLLNVAVFAASGILGMLFLLQTLQRLSVMRQISGETVPEGEVQPGPAVPGAAPSVSEAILLEEAPSQPIGVGPQPSPERRQRPEVWRNSAAAAEDPSALDSLRGQVLGPHVKKVFVCWIVTFGVVGAQMAWVLRPFFASSGTFALFAPRGSNFFEGVFHALMALLR